MSEFHTDASKKGDSGFRKAGHCLIIPVQKIVAADEKGNAPGDLVCEPCIEIDVLFLFSVLPGCEIEAGYPHCADIGTETALVKITSDI